MQTSAVRLSLILYFSVGRSSTELYPPLATASDTKIKSKTDKWQNLSNKTAPFPHSTLSPHKQLNRGQLGFPDSETQRTAFFLSLTQPLCSTLLWAAPFWRHIYPWFYDTKLSWFHCYFFRLSSYSPLFPDLSTGQERCQMSDSGSRIKGFPLSRQVSFHTK